MNHSSFLKASLPIIGFVLFGGFAFAAQTDMSNSISAPIQPSAETLKVDLNAAGFMQSTVVEQAQTRFSSPNYYFRVGEKVQGTDWGDGGNLISVLIIRKQPNWSYQNGQMEAIDILGKTQVRFSTDQNYIVVTGPDKDKIVSLGNRLKNKY